MAAMTRQILLLRSQIYKSRSSISLHNNRLMSSSSASDRHQEEHEYRSRCEYLGSWEASKDPKEAQAKLAKLRREYAKQVGELRKEYFNEMELQRQEKQMKDAANKEAIRIAKEVRKAAKAAKSQVEAAQRKIVDEEFRQTLMKEREEKLEYWRKREKAVEDRKKEKKELLKRQSSIWIEERELEKKIMEATIDTHRLS
ncbi:hypothetical protein ACHQM5_025604 [Ranunculus cassubicifolius]